MASSLAPAAFPNLPPITGVRISVAATGIKYPDRPDLLLMQFDKDTQIAGVFTTSRCPSAPVDWCKQHLKGGEASALVVNAGNANAFTGKAGAEACETVVAAVADTLMCRPSRVFAASTGVIGEVLPTGPILEHIGSMADDLDENRWPDAATAILTTDTFPKGATRTATINGAKVTLNGVAKGSGMIAPDMATMLAFVVSDAAISHDVLQSCLANAVEQTFNRTTVDSDTSTSDTVLAFATGAATHEVITDPEDPAIEGFQEVLTDLCRDLAIQVVKDGEGASKFIEVRVLGAVSDTSAKAIAFSIANSPLVKTAIAGEDANWGRIIMAVGKAGEPADRDKLAVRIGGIDVARDGAAVPDFDETPIAAHMKGQEIEIEVTLNLGDGTATVWTCDLTHGYISINADYRS